LYRLDSAWLEVYFCCWLLLPATPLTSHIEVCGSFEKPAVQETKPQNDDIKVTIA
jgi:hypothetical protein